MLALSRALAGLLLAVCLCAAGWAQDPRAKRTVVLWLDKARPILSILSHLQPADLKERADAWTPALWSDWATKRDAEIRARLVRGDEDSLVNLLLFGTSFTRQPRLTRRQLETALSVNAADPAAIDSKFNEITRQRLDDLLAAAARPGDNERLA
jgi:hypothetical protein